MLAQHPQLGHCGESNYAGEQALNTVCIEPLLEAIGGLVHPSDPHQSGFGTETHGVHGHIACTPWPLFHHFYLRNLRSRSSHRIELCTQSGYDCPHVG